MNCYYCEQKPGPGGMRLRSLTAAGICHECGVAVCRDHGRRAEEDRVLRCEDCARRKPRKLTTPEGATLLSA